MLDVASEIKGITIRPALVKFPPRANVWITCRRRFQCGIARSTLPEVVGLTWRNVSTGCGIAGIAPLPTGAEPMPQGV